MFKLSMNFSNPDINLTKAEVKKLINLIHNADSEFIIEIIEFIKDSMINEYYETELSRLQYLALDPRYKLEEIKNTLEGILIRITPKNSNSGGYKKKRKSRTV
jgi:hypothetical protein